ncbi:alanyl-tRNA synthetase [Theileria orientalis strain Shintoku]|uniref:Alanine--tRNA ligase n=1 Tax=Theileria orientalis strain Shintoku TaxID=869250 RepID=J4C7R5_THEOR|nr:alanyl-tRNA synthetase [Theileria orientalis strain Shintoku]BAM39498.1 alanyl-tRNA synthetase [Theileria orientalis strain Shintoku]|eukprot:XP_009689799.1 alanyl-tRNA synthetase [Theileria orientalis strain Shintoku]
MSNSSNLNNIHTSLDLNRSNSKWVRKQFVDYFVSKNHTYWPSASVLPNNDPTLLFVNAGMNQFKDIIMGKSDENTEFGKLRTACNSQKCIRAGGKHNDLEDVGHDCYHNTYFEMLGNWSFGDYFKEKAISYAWELLTEVYKLDPERLYVTYFGGNDNCPADLESRDLWTKYLPSSKILPFGQKENFWEMADTGPCGPCTEIHYDHVGNRDASSLVNMDDPKVVELWNLVFMQYNRNKDGKLEKLPKPCVDTGMGLERLCAILRGSNSNYDSDLLHDLILYINQLLPKLEAYTGGSTPLDVAYRVVSDHIRCLSIAIADRVYPSNEGRGYVLRRILRRAVRYCRDYLGTTEPFLHKLVPCVSSQLGDAYQNLKEYEEDIKSVILDEEKLFLVTLGKGVEKFKKMAEKCTNKQLTGTDAFLLYQSYGFPLDLTVLMSKELGLSVDVEGYNQELKLHQEKSEGRVVRDDGSLESKCDNLLKSLSADKIDAALTSSGNKYTDDALKYDWDSLNPVDKKYEAKLVSILTEEGVYDRLDYAPGDVFGLVFDRTPFYAEGGGQVYDTGHVDDLKVLRVYKMSGLVIHFCTSEENGSAEVGGVKHLSVDYKRRVKAACNHTATHILNFVLREVLDQSTYQRGSQLDDEKLKFDYSYNGALPEELIVKIEERMKDFVRAEATVRTKEIEYKQALEIPGIRANFDEKYPEVVRVVNVDMGHTDFNGELTSTEVCGGTHLSNTKTIEDVAVIGEEGISKGVRRLTMITNEQCHKSKEDFEAFVRTLDDLEMSLKPINYTKEDTAVAAQNANENMIKLTALRGAVEVHKTLPLLSKRKLLKRFEELIDKQVGAGKAHQKRLSNLAKLKAGVVVESLQGKSYDEFEYKEEAAGNPAVLKIAVDELEGDLKFLNIFVQVISKSFPKLAVVAWSSGNDSVCCKVNSPSSAFNALAHADGVAAELNVMKGAGLAKGSETNAMWTINKTQ